jgi:hypothetical protein
MLKDKTSFPPKGNFSKNFLSAPPEIFRNSFEAIYFR